MNMRSTKLTDAQLAVLRPLEKQLQVAVAKSEVDLAIELASKIQDLFPQDRKHHRLLRAKLWLFEACIDANRLNIAEKGLIGISQLASPSTRIALEAGGLLAIVYLRQKKVASAKAAIAEVILKINNITSDVTRHQFQQRLISRIEEECILSELIGTADSALEIDEIQAEAIRLIQSQDEAKILEIIGSTVPTSSIKLLNDVHQFSILRLPAPDRKLLAAPPNVQERQKIGKTAFSMLRRIAWKTFCKPSSPIFKLWSKQTPEVFNKGYFSAAVITTFNDFRIGLPMLAGGVAALVMKYSAEEFCELAKPKGFMIKRDEKDE